MWETTKKTIIIIISIISLQRLHEHRYYILIKQEPIPHTKYTNNNDVIIHHHIIINNDLQNAKRLT